MCFPYPFNHGAVVSYPIEALTHIKLNTLAYFCFHWKVQRTPVQPDDSTEGAGAPTSLSSRCWGYTCPVFSLPCAAVGYFCILSHNLCLFLIPVRPESRSHTQRRFSARWQLLKFFVASTERILIHILPSKSLLHHYILPIEVGVCLRTGGAVCLKHCSTCHITHSKLAFLSASTHFLGLITLNWSEVLKTQLRRKALVCILVHH